MIEPEPAATMWRPAARQARYVPRRLISITESQSSSG